MITLFVMQGCGYCHKAQDMLKDLILSGMIKVKDISEAPGHVNAAPFFKAHNGKEHMGLPQSPNELLEVLEISKENLHHPEHAQGSGCSGAHIKEGWSFGPDNSGIDNWINKCTGYLTLSQLPAYHSN